MKGKKTDKDFVAEFIMDCAKKGLFNLDNVLDMAQKEIEDIDNVIRNIVSLKIRRNKLLDVLDSLKKTNKAPNADKLILSFYQVKNLQLARVICQDLETDKTLQCLYTLNHASQHDIHLTVKELCEIKVLMNKDKKIVPAPNFKAFQSFVSK